MQPNHAAAFDVEVFTTADRARMDAACAVRVAVFVDEQGVPADEELDAHDRDDPAARHALVRVDGTVVGAGRFYVRDARTVQIGRMAVRSSARGRGIGRALLDALIERARADGYVRASLNAQVHALTFYAASGFRPVGATFVECEILHQAMEREIG